MEKVQSEFIVYIVSMSLLCFLWEFMYCCITLKHYKKVLKRDYIFCVINSIISTCSFIVIIFYLDSFNIIIQIIDNYDRTITNIIYYITFVLIIIVSSLEKVYFTENYKLLFDV